MAHDRHDGDDVALTHEFLSIMLGTRRASVMEAIHALEDRGLIRATRGHVLIHDGKVPDNHPFPALWRQLAKDPEKTHLLGAGMAANLAGAAVVLG